MGRHSAVDDSDEADVAVAAPVADRPLPRGRHAHPEDAEDTGLVPTVDVRAAESVAARQDDQPTEQIALSDLLAAADADTLAAAEAETARLPEPAPPGSELVSPPLEAAPEPELLAPAEAEPAGEQAVGPESTATEGAPGPAAGPPARGSQSTAADLALLRRHPDVRARVIAAVVVPFVLYVAVMLLIGAHGVHYLVWIWIPMVSAGVLAGLMLDAAHRRHGRPDDGEPS